VSTRYRALFSTPGVGRLLFGSVVGRLPVGMFSLAILLFVHGATGSFLTAGLAVGAFTAGGAVVGPALGALVDRVGQTPVLLPAAVLQAALLSALVLVGLETPAHLPVAVLVAVAAAAGASLPPIAGCVRALWAEAVPAEELQTAYALDATTQETIWTLGPLLVGVVAGFASPAAAVEACAVLTVAGTAYFATSPLSRGWRAQGRERHRGSALAARPDLRLLLYTVVLAGIVIGAVEVGLTALAVQGGARWASGPLLALFSVGSMTGGLLYAARSWTVPLARRYAMLLGAMTCAVAPLIAVPPLAAAFALSVLAGLALAPMITCQFALVGALAPEGTVTEAFTWHRAATVAGMAGGSAVGGSLIDVRGPGAAFALGCAGVAAAAALAVLGRRRIEPTPAAVATAASSAPPAAAPAAASSERPAPPAVPAVVPPARALAGPAPYALAAEAVALAADAIALAARTSSPPVAPAERPRAGGPLTLAAEAVALAAEVVAQGAAAA
jgi:MFS family permease